MTQGNCKTDIKASLVACFGNHFSGVKGAHHFLEELSINADSVSLEANEYLFKEHDTCQHFFILESGAMMLERSTASGSRQVFAFLVTNNLLGITESAHYSYGAKAITCSSLIRVNAKLLRNNFKKFSAVAKRYNDITGRILSLTLDHLFIMGQLSAHQRLAHFLLDIEQRINSDCPHFMLPMSRQDIADYLGISLETTSRGFSKLKNEGLIKVQGNSQITLLEREKLCEYSVL